MTSPDAGSARHSLSAYATLSVAVLHSSDKPNAKRNKDENAFFYSINCFTAISIIIVISRPVFAQNQDWLYWMFILFYVIRDAI